MRPRRAEALRPCGPGPTTLAPRTRERSDGVRAGDGRDGRTAVPRRSADALGQQLTLRLMAVVVDRLQASRGRLLELYGYPTR
ncbi:hypothetical protein [Micromonospora sp. B9E7]|uniref:hypothetical protein n=1 Tax=Micromonospora sp. B9E7 TaxID=3153574 RepID=UPI00325E2CAC